MLKSYHNVKSFDKPEFIIMRDHCVCNYETMREWITEQKCLGHKETLWKHHTAELMYVYSKLILYKDIYGRERVIISGP